MCGWSFVGGLLWVGHPVAMFAPHCAFGVMQMEDVFLLVDQVVALQQIAELAHLVEEGSGQPMFAIELVVFDIREHQMRHAEHLVEGGFLVIARQ